MDNSGRLLFRGDMAKTDEIFYSMMTSAAVLIASMLTAILNPTLTM
jgi:hypothetical protein